MKKIFTLAAVAIMSSASFAQIETGWINPELVGYDTDGKTLTTSIDAGVVLASSANVQMKNAYKVDYKLVSITAEADIANTVTIGSEDIDLSANVGMQGQTNPSPNSVGTKNELGNFIGGQTGGAVLRFDVSSSGYLFVFHKATSNKNYFAWEGLADLSAATLLAIRHIGQPVKTEVGSYYDYTMPYDEMGYTIDEDITKVIQVKTGEKDEAGNDITVPSTTLKFLNELIPDKFTSTNGNCLSVIAIPVYVDGDAIYYVNACGSKISTNGFAFIPDSNPTMDGLKEIAVSFSKSGESAVAGVAEAKSEVAAPVKVLGANGIQIGNYNVAGQRVK